MKKLIRGLLDFQRHGLKAYRSTFERLAKGQAPDCLFITCSDSRMVPNLLVATNPGDLFVMRNVGNLIPPSDGRGHSVGDTSEAAAIEYSLMSLPVIDIVVCGHSGCGAMQALLDGGPGPQVPNLASWLQHGRAALESLKSGMLKESGKSEVDQLSQLNVLLQLRHIESYPLVSQRLVEGRLRLHGWWFDIAEAQVYGWKPLLNRFVPLDEAESEALLNELDGGNISRLETHQGFMAKAATSL